MAQMLRIMQLLSRVEEGENLGRCCNICCIIYNSAQPFLRALGSPGAACSPLPALPCRCAPGALSVLRAGLWPGAVGVSLRVRGCSLCLSRWGAKSGIRGAPGLVCQTNTSAW